MALDAIMPIYSMTKPIAAGHDDALTKRASWKPVIRSPSTFPSSANLKVFAGTDAAGTMRLEAPKHRQRWAS
jgi:hypothetical protein